MKTILLFLIYPCVLLGQGFYPNEIIEADDLEFVQWACADPMSTIDRQASPRNIFISCHYRITDFNNPDEAFNLKFIVVAELTSSKVAIRNKYFEFYLRELMRVKPGEESLDSYPNEINFRYPCEEILKRYGNPYSLQMAQIRFNAVANRYATMFGDEWFSERVVREEKILLEAKRNLEEQKEKNRTRASLKELCKEKIVKFRKESFKKK